MTLRETRAHIKSQKDEIREIVVEGEKSGLGISEENGKYNLNN